MFKIVNKKNSASIGIIVIVLWTIIAITSPNMYFFNGDEIHACNIAKQLSYTEIIQLMRAEGHTFIWYFLIKPFLQYDFFYPWIIKIINFIFMLGSVLLLWYRSPFNIITKTLIIFSFPFLLYYPTYARCYTIGIFLLFWLTILYNDKLKKPLLYSTLLFLTANTSLMAFIGAAAFGILFIIDIYKEKNFSKIILVSTIAILTVLSLYIQWHNPIIPVYAKHEIFFYNLKTTFYKLIQNNPFPKTLISVGLALSLFIPSIYFLKNKLSFFFYAFTWFCLLTLFSQFYPGNAYHHYFGLIYIIITYWISYDKIPNCNIRKKVFNCYFYYILLCLIFIKTIPLPYKADMYNWNFYPQRILEITGKNAIIYADIPFINDILGFQNQFNLKAFNHKEVNDLDNFMKKYQEVDTYSLLDYIKKMEPNSYLLISYYKLAAARDYKEFHKSFKLISLYRGTYLYKLD